ncbi:MAG: PKD domain-containing protein [Candidatus Bipolaricaulota bacterium]|nr:PKD domain-containing protein [Candidatus Bipolaricaulota bacterium]MDW8111136.1 PKD domain-containing protein [Candidatus Bipolaricaulota bacterium]MDW8329750.1 PKD domain-containing protein [Candidatus Bipolaricaulota bacterium]
MRSLARRVVLFASSLGLFGLTLFSATHAQQALSDIIVESKTVPPNSVSTINIIAENGPDTGIADIQGTLRFDIRVLRANKVEGQQDYEVFANIDNNAGEIKFLAIKLRAPYPKAGPLVRIEFQVLGSLGAQSDLRLTLRILRDPDGRDVPNKITNGLITVGTGPVNQAPVAKFSFSPASPKTNETITFKDESTDPDGAADIISWDWDFGDGTKSTERNPTKQYAQKKIYTVTLIVTDKAGAKSAPFSQRIPVGITAPKADFAFSPPSPEVGDEVQFTDRSTDDGQITNREWDFGDGTRSTDQNPKKKYTQAGTFRVRLTVRDNDGAENTVEKEIVVRASTKPVISVFPNPARESATFSFSLPSGATEGILIVFSMSGKVVLRKDKLTGGQFAWDIKRDNVPSGPYYYIFIALKNGATVGRSRIERLVIQR